MNMKMVMISIGVFLSIAFIGCDKDNPINGNNSEPLIIEESEILTDIGGNQYRTVRIGNQIWMAENLRTTHYADGSPVEHFAYNNDTAFIRDYGRLYKWNAAMRNAASTNANPSGVQGASPDGWHIPSVSEWMELIEYLGGESVAGGKLKETGEAHWQNPNSGATNESLFAALPAGWLDFTGNFDGLGRTTFLTTSSAENAWEVYIMEINYNSSSITRGGLHPDDAVPIRCIKDE